MRIEDLRITRRGPWLRASARLRWHHARRDPDLLYVDVLEARGEGFTASPDGFLMAALPLALLHGEEEVEVEEALSPTLVRGLEAVMERVHGWYPAWRRSRVVASQGLQSRDPPSATRTACFLSGGVDSLAMIRENRLQHDRARPQSIETALHLFGLNTHDLTGDHRPVPARWARFEAYRTQLDQFAADVGLSLVPVRTNVRALYPDFETWGRLGWSLGIVAVAHHFRDRFSDIWLADWGPEVVSSLRSEQLTWLQDYATEAVRPRLGQAGVTRLPKVRSVAQWPPALRVLKTCIHDRLPEKGMLNCGRCPKCVRTLLALIVVGARERAITFPPHELTSTMLAGLGSADRDLAGYLVPVYEELLEAFRERDDRTPYVGALETAIAECRRLAETGRPVSGLISRLLQRLGLRIP